MADLTWSFDFTDAELNAIYTAIENADTGALELEAAYDSVLEKIAPAGIRESPARRRPAQEFRYALEKIAASIPPSAVAQHIARCALDRAALDQNHQTPEDR